MFVTKAKIDGMRCGQCEAHVNELLSKIDGALLVFSSHLKGEASIASPYPIEEEKIIHALAGSGYRVQGAFSVEEEKEGWRYRHALKAYRKRKEKEEKKAH